MAVPPEDVVVDGGEAVPEPEASGERREHFSGVGVRVTAVLTAAEKAADQIRSLAREEADDIRRTAEVDATQHSTQRRLEAEQESRQLVAEAREQAEAIRAGAQEVAHQAEETARRRQQRMREETRILEERLEWAREGLREITARLQAVLPEEPSFHVDSGPERPDEET